MSIKERIVLERHGRLWHWTLTTKGEQHTGQRGEATAELATQQAEIHRNQIDLTRHFRAQRSAAANFAKRHT